MIVMRCKNCGTDNDENRYICEICGSPLYDEDEINTNKMPSNEPADTPSYANTDRNNYNTQPEMQRRPVNNSNNTGNGGNDGAQKKSIIVIAILAVILIAVIASVAVIAHNRNNDNKDETSSSQLTKADMNSDDDDYDSNYYKKPEKTTEKTTKESTTEKTTKKKTTEKTTAAKMWYINTSSSGGGETEGDGEYKDGKKATLIARADDGYVFDGWYSNGEKVSSSTKYTFKVTENASFSAVFSPAPTEPVKTTEKTTAGTTEPTTNSSENTASQNEPTNEDIDVMFGDDD